MTRIMYDSVAPSAIPRNVEMVAGYIDGTTYRWSQSDWDRFPNSVKVRIARRTYTNDGHVLDVEYGIPTVWPINRSIVDWVLMRRKSGIEPTIYCNEVNDWGPIKQLFDNARVRHPQWWVARYNNIREIPPGAIARQFANPPLAGGHYDLSIVADYWPGVDKERVERDMTPDESKTLNEIASKVNHLWTRYRQGIEGVQTAGIYAVYLATVLNTVRANAVQLAALENTLSENDAAILAAIKADAEDQLDVAALASMLAEKLGPSQATYFIEAFKNQMNK